MSRQFEEKVIEPLYFCCEENEIPGYPGYYATPDGDILKRIPSNDPDEFDRVKELPLHKGDKHGHVNVRIKGLPGEAKEPYVHRLVAKTHLENPNNYPFVCHKDDDPSNNSVDNLYYGTPKDNAADCRRNGHFHPVTQEEREKGLEKMRRPVWSEKDGVRTEYCSIADAKRATGAKNADKVLSGEREQACGYKFGYLEKDK